MGVLHLQAAFPKGTRFSSVTVALSPVINATRSATPWQSSRVNLYSATGHCDNKNAFKTVQPTGSVSRGK